MIVESKYQIEMISCLCQHNMALRVGKRATQCSMPESGSFLIRDVSLNENTTPVLHIVNMYYLVNMRAT